MAWVSMIARCTNPTSEKWHSHGGRGITVCPAWRKSFETFFADMGPCPPKYMIERVDNDGNYCRSNCIWATAKQQGRNKRNNIVVVVSGVQMTLAEAVEQINGNYGKIWKRLRRGWPIEKALGLDSK